MSARGSHDWRLDALCARFRSAGGRDRLLDRLVDRMWALENGDDPEADRDLRRGAVAVCAVCPVRLRCLATAIVQMEQTGIFGGLDRHGRIALARFAEGQGVECRGGETGHMRVYRPGVSVPAELQAQRVERLAAWLERHPDAVDYARDMVRCVRRRKPAPPMPASFAPIAVPADADDADGTDAEPGTLF